MIPFVFPVFLEKRPRSRQSHKRANRLALGLIALTALAGLVLKYLP